MIMLTAENLFYSRMMMMNLKAQKVSLPVDERFCMLDAPSCVCVFVCV